MKNVIHPYAHGVSQVALVIKNPPTNAEDARDPGSTPRSGRSLEEEMATHSSILDWKIPRTEEPGRLQSMGLQSVGHDCLTNTLLGTLLNFN